jgi:undecaprenyl-diphosphatase
LSIWEGIILGIIQGLTEFLPVSSSGHLVIAQGFLPGFQQQGVLFDVMLHIGTLLAVVFFLRQEIFDIVKALMPRPKAVAAHENHDDISVRRRIALYIIIGTIVTGTIGVLCKDAIHQLFESVEIAAAMLLVTGFLLFATERMTHAVRTEKDMTIVDALVIGLAQAVALIPGISRSGTTIAFGLFRNINGETAARFSFLLSIPAILGAMVLETGYMTAVSLHEIIVYGVGMITAAVVGFGALKLLFFIIKKRELRFFAYYCWCVGTITLIIKTV